MFLVKNCDSKYNISLEQRYLQLGSLDYYRKIENTEIADAGEGAYEISIEITNSWIPNDIINNVFHSHININGKKNKTVSPEIRLNYNENQIFFDTEIRVREMQEDATFVDSLKANIKVTHCNCYIFCMSILDDLSEVKSCFNGYDDFWYFDYDLAEIFASSIKKELKKQLNRNISMHGWKLSMNDDTNAKEVLRKDIQIECVHGKVNYTPRIYRIDGADKLSVQHHLSILEEVPFIKPDIEIYKRNKEYRFVFKVYYRGDPISTSVNTILVSVPDVIKKLAMSGNKPRK
ncbi:TPA: hypothetical protein ACGQXI_002856 [Klebsiella michiganensis]|nr:hypothetical protein [Klebsiella michiganensis]